MHKDSILYLLPVHGSDTNWYKNLLVDPKLKISVDGAEIPVRARPITDRNSVDDIVRKCKSKYGNRLMACFAIVYLPIFFGKFNRVSFGVNLCYLESLQSIIQSPVH